jgi:CMP-N,N'-diacetyllegionaminic acid synthase
MKLLYVIPARGGSKGIPGKNVKSLCGKPLLHYSLEYARLFAADEDICLTTDSDEIAACAQIINYTIPFKRPAILATDEAGTYPVLQHALSYYEAQGKKYDALVLLQPTSPFRERFHLTEAIRLFNDNVDMVVSVQQSATSPYFTLFEETSEGYLEISKGDGMFKRRQDVPPVYEFNGSIYIINTASLRSFSSFAELKKRVKYVMKPEFSIDLDTPEDWEYAEFICQKKMKL